MQVIVDSLIRSSELALLAVGLSMVYSVLRFPNFAHVEFAPIGAYLTLVGSTTLGIPLIVAAPVAMVATGVIGVAADRAVFIPLRGRSPGILMIASLALGITIKALILAIWGPSARLYDIPLGSPIFILGIRISAVQLGILCVAIVSMTTLHLMFRYTKIGVAMRGVADNPKLAEASAINTKRVIRDIWFISGALGALGGIMLGLDTQLQPQMGYAIVIPVFAAVLIGGIGNAYGAMLGSLVIGFSESVGLAINWGPLAGLLGDGAGGYLYIPTGYKLAIPFALLILILLLFPRGLLGGRSR